MKLIFELVVQDAKAAQQIEMLRGNLKEINKELKEVDADSKAFKSLVDEAAKTRVEIKKLTDQQKELQKEFKAATVPSDSLAGLRIEYSKLTEQITKLSKAERESESGKKLIANAASIKNEINGIQESVGNFTGSVGNYKGGILAASEALGTFGGSLSNQTQALQQAVSIFDLGSQSATKFFEITRAGGKAFKDNLSSFREYVAGLRDSKKAADESKESNEGIAEAVEGVAEGGENAGKGLQEAAKGAGFLSKAGNVLGLVLKSLGIGLIIAAIVALIAVFQRFAPLIDRVEQAVEGLSAAFDVYLSRYIKVVEGFVKLVQGDFDGAFNDVSEAVSGLGESMVNAALSAAQLRKEMQDLEDAQKDFELTTAKAEAAVAKLTVSLKDRTKSDSERLKIAADITKIERANLAEKTALIDKEIDIEKRRLLLTGQVSQDQADQIAAGNFELARSLEDEFKLQADQTDRIRELLIKRTNAEGESATLLERIDNRRNAILEDRKARQEAAAQKAAAVAEREQKTIEAQITRIRELEKSVRDFDASTITNDFDRQAVEIENKRAEALEKVTQSREVLTKKIAEQKGVITEADKKELELISEQSASIVAAYDKQQKDLTIQREKAIDKQKQELSELSLEITELAERNAEKLAEAQIEISNADFSKQRTELLSVLNERKKVLTEQLLDGTISQRQFKEEFLREQEAFNLGSLELEKKRAEEIKRVSEALEQARIESAKAALAVRLAAIQSETDAQIQAAKDRAAAEGGDAGDTIEQLRLRAIKRRAEAEQEFQDSIRAATDASKNAQIEAAKEVGDADAKVHEDKLARLEEERQKRLELQQAILDTAGQVAGAIFEIERNKIDSELKTKTEALDIEYQKKKEAAQGNQVELERLDKEYNTKKEKLEKEAAKKRQKVAIIEAVINTALAVIKALTGSAPPLSFVLAALTAVAGAAQIAVISSQKFAEGGVAMFQRAGKSGKFGGRYHAQGGTRGKFEDGTEVEVEKDEIFVILNRKASREINQLSEHNYRHGGRRFDSGGSLDFTPQIPVPGESAPAEFVINVQAEFSEEQVEFIAGEIAGKTSLQTRAAVSAGLDDRNRTAEREAVMEANSEV